jgi:alpha-amylase/alpha-mannosidase (GH57 family)
MTTYWAPLLHVYQPPTQDIKILRLINDECYKPLLSVIDKNDNAKFTLNINGVLIEMLYEYGLSDTMYLLKNLVSENKIEIVGTAKFHPILPLIPKKEVYHQIRMNEEINRREFGDIWEKKGFFPPELAISSKIAKIVHELGYKWIIQSGIACPVEEKGVDWPYDKIYRSPNGLQLFFRDDIISNKISFKKITAKEFVEDISIKYNDKKKDNKIDTYILTAMDGETFGHHIKNYEKTFLGKTLEIISEENDIQTIFISNLEQHFPIAKKTIIPKESSWSTSFEDILNDIPYPLWKHPDNNIHKYYWKIVKSLNNLMDLADNLDLTEDWEVENYYTTARWFYDRGLHSCPIWWANPQNGTWSPNLIYNGLELLLKAALNAQMALVHASKDDGDANFDSISYYHGLLLMELYSITKKTIKKSKNI